MKKFISIIFLFLTLNTFSQESELKWHTDLNKAIELSVEDNKPLFMFFTGSDWCGWCIRLQKEVFFKPEFVKWAKENLTLVELDFPRRKKNSLSESQQAANNILAEKYNPNGYFPYVVVLDNNGNFLGDLGYENTTPEQYIKLIESF